VNPDLPDHSDPFLRKLAAIKNKSKETEKLENLDSSFESVSDDDSDSNCIILKKEPANKKSSSELSY
jgi:hypothetical protein